MQLVTAGRIWPSVETNGLLTKVAAKGIRGENGAVLPSSEWRRGVQWNARYAPAYLYPGFDQVGKALSITDIDETYKNYDSKDCTDLVAYPFFMYATETASYMNGVPDDLGPNTAKVLALYESYLLARHLWTGQVGDIAGTDYYPGNASFKSHGIDLTPTPGTPVSLQAGFALILKRFSDQGWPGEVTFHAPTWLLAEFQHEMLPTLSGGRYDVAGRTVVVDPGYPGTGPDSWSGSTPATATWLFATGPIEYDIDTFMPPRKIQESNINQETWMGERVGILRYHGAEEVTSGPASYGVMVTYRS